MSTNDLRKEPALVCLRGNRNILGECICDAGFTHDFTLLRYENCSLAVGFYEAYMSVGLALSIFTIVFGQRGLKKSKGKVKELLIIFLISAVFSFAAFVAGLSSRHIGRETWFFFGGFVVFMGIGYSRFVFLFLEVNYSFAGKKMFWRNALVGCLCLNAFLVGINIGVILPIIIFYLGNEYSPTYDVVTYNFAVRLLFCVFPIHLCAIVPIAYVITKDIIRKLENPNDVTATGDASKRRSREMEKDPSKESSLDAYKNTGSAMPKAERGEILKQKLENVRKRLVIFRIINIAILPPVEVLFMTLIFGVLLIWPQYVYIAPYIGGLFVMSIPTIPLSEIYVLTQTGFVKQDATGESNNNSSKKDDSKDSKGHPKEVVLSSGKVGNKLVTSPTISDSVMSNTA